MTKKLIAEAIGTVMNVLTMHFHGRKYGYRKPIEPKENPN